MKRPLTIFPVQECSETRFRKWEGPSACSGSVITVSEVLAVVFEAQLMRCPSVSGGQLGDRRGTPWMPRLGSLTP